MYIHIYVYIGGVILDRFEGRGHARFWEKSFRARPERGFLKQARSRVAVSASVNKGLRHSRSLLDRALLLRPANLARPIYFAITRKTQHFVSYTNYPHSRWGEGSERGERCPFRTITFQWRGRGEEARSRRFDECQSRFFASSVLVGMEIKGEKEKLTS